MSPSREVICTDALPWMAEHEGAGGVVTSLPDADEMGWEIPAWRDWFTEAAGLALAVPGPDATAVFYQTDRKYEGAVESKAALLMLVAEARRYRMLWHKIALRRDVGKIDLHRPGYTHLMAFSREAKPGPATPDVFPAGTMVYPNAMGATAAEVAINLVSATSPVIYDPFCGRGSVLAIANALGHDAVGIDIDPDQCELARRLRLER